MAKTIKFNLILDGNPVRDLNGLRENFNIDDILIYYRNGLLKKWLFSRGYIEELSKIEAITLRDNREIMRELVNIFRVNIEPHQLEELFHSFDSRTQRRAMLVQLKESNFEYQAVIKSYCDGYDSLLKGVLEDKDNMALIKNSMRQISENYIDIFRHHLPSLYDEFLIKAPLAIYASLMNQVLRNDFLHYNKIVLLTDTAIVKLLTNTTNYQDILIIKHKEDTNYSWKNLVNSGKKCLIFDMTDRNDVMVASSNTKEFTEEQIVSEDYFIEPNFLSYESNDYNKAFTKKQAVGKVFNGLQFRSSNYNDFVKYLIINNSLRQELTNRKIFEVLKGHIKTFKGNTKEYWKDIEPKGKKFMIVGIREGNFVRSAGKHGEQLSADEVNGKFPLLDGIDYKSNNPKHEIGYLEV